MKSIKAIKVLEIIRRIVKERGGTFEEIDKFAEKVLGEIKENRFKKLEIPKTQRTLFNFQL